MKKNKEKFHLQNTHNATKRDYLKRMNNQKIQSMKIARKFEKQYWDGSRKFGYGGYKFIQGYWKSLALKLVKDYNLNDNSKILDIGCGKGFLLYEIKNILKNVTIVGIDISKYAIKNSHPEVKKNVFNYKAEDNLQRKWKKNYFDLVISLGCLHNLEINNFFIAIKNINYLAKRSYLMVESYRNEDELFNLQCWALTCKSFFSKSEWLFLFDLLDYKGDYEFIYFK